MKLSKRESILLIIAIIALAGFLYYNYFFKPYRAEAAQLEATILEQRQQLDREKLEKTQIALQTQKIDQLTDELKGELESIPTGVDEAELLVFLENTVSGLCTNQNVQFMVEIKSLGYCQINTATLSFSTNYPNLITILKRLEQGPYRNRILNMSANSKTKKELEPVDEVGESPGDDEADSEGQETPDEETVQPVMVEPYLLEVFLSIDFFSFSGAIDPGKEYPFMTGTYNNPDLFPIPDQVPWYYPEAENNE